MKTTVLTLVALGVIAWSPAQARTHVGVGISFGAPAPVIVRRAPPPRVVERVVVAPGPGYVWLPGHYSWAGNHWVWISGAWVLPPRPDARWVDGSWNPQSQQWIEGHWEVPPPPPAPVVTAPPGPPPAPVSVVTPSPAPVVVPPAPPSVTAPTDIVLAEPPPPAPEIDVQTVAPGPDYVWISGYWGWENGRREWYRGHWERPPHGYHLWVSPRWEHHPRGFVYVRGYWR